MSLFLAGRYTVRVGLLTSVIPRPPFLPEIFSGPMSPFSPGTFPGQTSIRMGLSAARLPAARQSIKARGKQSETQRMAGGSFEERDRRWRVFYAYADIAASATTERFEVTFIVTSNRSAAFTGRCPHPGSLASSARLDVFAAGSGRTAVYRDD